MFLLPICQNIGNSSTKHQNDNTPNNYIDNGTLYVRIIFVFSTILHYETVNYCKFYAFCTQNLPYNAL